MSDNGWRPNGVAGCGLEDDGRGGGAGGPRKEDRGGEGPTGRVAGVGKSNGVGVPATPGAYVAKGNTGGSQCSGAHAAEAMPGKGTPRGACKE